MTIFTNPNSIEGMLDRFRAAHSGQRSEIVKTIAGSFKPKVAGDLLMELLSNEKVMNASGRVRADGLWPDEWRSVAYKHLIGILCSTEQSFSFASGIAENDSDFDRRGEAIGILHQYFAEHPKTFGTLARIADGNHTNALDALYGIAKAFGHLTDSYSYLTRATDCIANDQLTVTAIGALARYHAQNQETRLLLEHIASSSGVRNTDERVRQALKPRSQEIRQAAIRAIAAAYGD